jgi:hypothetical protein
MGNVSSKSYIMEDVRVNHFSGKEELPLPNLNKQFTKISN